MLAKYSGVESERTALKKLEKEEENFRAMCLHAPKSRGVKLGSFMSQLCNDG